MKKMSACAALAAALLAPQVFAQSATFEGGSVGYNVNLNSTSTELSVGADRLNGMGSTELGGSLQAAYGWAMGANGIISLGATYSLNDINSGEFVSAGTTLKLKRRDAYSIYVEPGFKVSPGTLAYAKLGYENASALAESQGITLSNTVDGFSGGFGLRALLDSHLYLQAEVKQVFYNSSRFSGAAADFKSTATMGSIGIGYQF
jgi:Outer membrane protein beta-barrel domain